MRTWVLGSSIGLASCVGPTVSFGGLDDGAGDVGETGTGDTGLETGEGAAAMCPDPLPASWIFCEDFEALEDPTTRFFEYEISGDVAVVDHTGASGNASLQVTYTPGDTVIGWINIAFGRNPIVYHPDLPHERPDEDFDDVYARVRLKMDADWPDQGPGTFMMLAAYNNVEWGQAARLLVESFEPHLQASPYTCVEMDGSVPCAEHNDPVQSPLGPVAGQTPLFSAAAADQWHCVEVHMKLNELGVADGVLEVWVDGAEEMSRHDLDWRGVWDAYGINLLQIPPGWHFGDAPASLRRWIDDVAIAETRVGCD